MPQRPHSAKPDDVDPELYEQAADLFLEACELDAEAREKLFERECRDDPVLREEVERLLAHDPADQVWIATRGPSGADENHGVRSSRLLRLLSQTPELTGPYSIVRLLGKGGMGEVYLAEQTGPIRRQVALKLVKRGMDSETVLSRFESEQRALAALDHPHIAKVHDAGETTTKLPYFVMEYVDGVRITRFADENGLNIRARLGLVTQLCDAMEHAHSRGVIHRDLKPSNILVTTEDDQEPCCKIIDFGIAKAVAAPPSSRTARTELGQALGTTAYMSPEQASLRPEAVDHRTDVYSLGVILYELLLGERPLDLDTSTAALHEVFRRIREDDPQPPGVRWRRLNPERMTKLAKSRCTSASSLGSQLGGDLSWITMKALAKERKRRYESARALGADIRSCLAHQPVRARPPSRLYRLRKYARRNRPFVLSAAVVFLVLSVGLVGSLSLRARTETALATTEAREAEILQLSDIKRLSRLREDLESLLARAHEKKRALHDWLERADELADRRSLHRATLSRVRERGIRSHPGNSNAAAAWVFADPADQWQYELLVELVDGLEDLAAPGDGAASIARVESLVDLVLSEAEIDERWREAIAAIADVARCPRYRGLEIARQDGLIPLGQEETSGLWEFSDARTGLLPRRSIEEWEISDETGIVLVLVPGGEFLMGSPAGERWLVERQLTGLADADDVRLVHQALGLLAAIARSAGTRALELQRLLEEALINRYMPGPLDELLHRVAISPFLLSKYELTQSVWTRVMEHNPSVFRGDGVDANSPFLAAGVPVNYVTWEQCREFNERTGLDFPTEAQWEYACRAGARGPFSGPGSFKATAWYFDHEGQRPHPPGQKRASGFGLHDMHGNLIEWTKDVYSATFYQAPEATARDPLCESGSTLRVCRGGGFGSTPWDCRSASRMAGLARHASDRHGFRPARALETRADTLRKR